VLFLYCSFEFFSKSNEIHWLFLIGFIHVIFNAIFDLIYDLHSFLSQLGRIASWTYELSDDDVIRARLRTLGVQEYKLKIEGGTEFVGLLYFPNSLLFFR
jgi:hypothetical protein